MNETKQHFNIETKWKETKKKEKKTEEQNATNWKLQCWFFVFVAEMIRLLFVDDMRDDSKENKKNSDFYCWEWEIIYLTWIDKSC